MPFQDRQGKMWGLQIDLPACRRVRDLVGINLLTLHLARLLQELSDPIRLCEVLWAACKPEADAAGLDLDAFLRRMAVAIAPVTDALLTGPGGLADFFQSLGQTEKANQLRTVWSRVKAMESLTPETATAAVDAAMDWMCRQILSGASGTAATNTPESPESIPTSQA